MKSVTEQNKCKNPADLANQDERFVIRVARAVFCFFLDCDRLQMLFLMKHNYKQTIRRFRFSPSKVIEKRLIAKANDFNRAKYWWMNKLKPFQF